MEFDVIVVGGGPSGSFSAFNLSKIGFKVLLLEKFARGRYKTCGGAVSSKSISFLPSIPSEIVERDIYGTRLFSPSGDELTYLAEKRFACTVYRTKFDSWLVRLAETEGTLVKEGTNVEKISISRSKVIVQATEDYFGKLLIGAFGVQPNLHKQLGVRSPTCAIAAQLELAMERDIIDRKIGDVCEFYFNSRYTDFGYAWLFPKREGVTIGLADRIGSKNLIGRLEDLFERTQIIKEKTSGARPSPIGPRSIQVNLVPNRPLEKTYGYRFLLVGDSAGFVNPFNGEGISYALLSAQIASRICESVLTNEDYTEEFMARYQQAWKEAFGGELNRGIRLQNALYGENYDLKWKSIIRFRKKIQGFQPELLF